jgi:hypothetical protein
MAHSADKYKQRDFSVRKYGRKLGKGNYFSLLLAQEPACCLTKQSQWIQILQLLA